MRQLNHAWHGWPTRVFNSRTTINPRPHLRILIAGVIGAFLMCPLISLAGPVVLPLYTLQPDGRGPEVQSDHWLLHLPGIAGRRWIDGQMMLGFRDGGFGGELQVYDWTGEVAGIAALRSYKHNQVEAQKVADYIADRAHKEPGLHITLTGHSGGTGIAVWALEKLPDDVKVDTVILLASALSPEYDLTRALSHVRGTCYAFCSENDVLVLNAGTKMLGTIDGKKTEAAGEFGFVLPKGADPKQYEKLIQKPYDKTWMQYNNLGDHMGCMLRPFAEKVIAPLLLREAKPATDAVKHQATAAKADGRS